MPKRFLVSVFALACHAIQTVSLLWSLVETKQQTSTAVSNCWWYGGLSSLSNTGPGVSSSFWEREGWLGAAQHNLGNDLPKTIKLMVSMKADVTKPDSSLAFPFYCQNWLNEGGAPRMVLCKCTHGLYCLHCHLLQVQIFLVAVCETLGTDRHSFPSTLEAMVRFRYLWPSRTNSTPPSRTVSGHLWSAWQSKTQSVKLSLCV